MRKNSIVCLLTLLALSLLSFFVACSVDSSHTVTFVQSGYEDVVVSVKDGGDLTDMPKPKTKIGYTAEWSEKEIKNVKKDIVVNCIETPKTYTVVFNALGGKLVDEKGNDLSGENFAYEYGADYSFPSVVKEGYDFGGWYAWKMAYPEQDKSWTYTEIPAVGKWNVCNEKDGVCSITVYATWKYEIVFRQENEEDVVLSYKNTPEGSTAISEKDIPVPKKVKGYTVTWKSFNLSDLNKNTVIEAVKKPNEYKVFYNISDGVSFPADVRFDESKKSYFSTVVFDCEYTLPVPEKDGFVFVKWTLNGKDITDGVWRIDSSVTLEPVFRERTEGTYKITFVFGGDREDVVIEKNKGDKPSLSDIPTLPREEGYDYSWKINGRVVSVNDILELTSDTTVVAAKSLKTYRIYFDTVFDVPVGSGLSYDETKKTYYAEYKYGDEVKITRSLPSYKTSDGSRMTFVCWKKDGVKTTVVTVRSDVTLTACWVDAKDDENWSGNR